MPARPVAYVRFKGRSGVKVVHTEATSDSDTYVCCRCRGRFRHARSARILLFPGGVSAQACVECTRGVPFAGEVIVPED